VAAASRGDRSPTLPRRDDRDGNLAMVQFEGVRYDAEAKAPRCVSEPAPGAGGEMPDRRTRKPKA
jgi:hypothetical protein